MRFPWQHQGRPNGSSAATEAATVGQLSQSSHIADGLREVSSPSALEPTGDPAHPGEEQGGSSSSSSVLHGGAGPSRSDSVLFSQPLPEAEEDGEEVEQGESFLLHCNRRRAKADPWVDMFVLVTYGVAIAKWWRLMPLSCIAAFGGHLALKTARWAWFASHPGSYLRWREPLVAILTAATLLSPIPTVVLLEMARALGKMGAAALGAAAPPSLHVGWLAGPAGVLLSVMGVVFVSRAQKMAILSLGYRTRLALHMPLHVLLAAWMAQAHTADVCGALTSATAAGLEPELQQQGLAAIRAWYSFFQHTGGLFYMYMMPMPPSSLPSVAAQGPLEQCRSVVGMLQVFAGLLLPLTVHVVGESRDYMAWRRRQSMGGGSMGGLSPAMARVYEAVWELAGGDSGVLGPATMLFWAMLFGAVWMCVSAMP